MIELLIESLSHEGRGIARINGKTIFVEGALPNELVLCEYVKKHKRFDEARVIKVLRPSAYRVEPRCPYVDRCGGCNVQHIHLDQQIQIKQQTLLEQLHHFGNLQPEIILPPLRGPEYAYRYKGRLSVKYVEKKQALLIGFHEKNGRYIADISSCDVLDPRVGYQIESLKTFIRQLSIFQQIPQIEIAMDADKVALVIRHLAEFTDEDKQQIIAYAISHHMDIYLHPNQPQSLYRLWPESGEERLSYNLADQQIVLKFYPTDFTQINPAINQQMVNNALNLLELNASDIVLDLFCGLGNFTLPIAKYCHHVVGIEGSLAMVNRAQENAIYNNITNATFHAANLAEVNCQVDWMRNSFNKILLDPPRTGALEILQQIPHKCLERIVYISCNPATLARDAGELVHKQGYRLVKAGVMDMFPHTKHVESIALFIK